MTPGETLGRSRLAAETLAILRCPFRRKPLNQHERGEYRHTLIVVHVPIAVRSRELFRVS